MPGSNGDIYITWPKMVGLSLSILLPMLGLILTVWTSLDGRIERMGGKLVEEMRVSMTAHIATPHPTSLSRNEALRLEAELRDKIQANKEAIRRGTGD